MSEREIVRHIVAWRYAEGTTQEQIGQFTDAFRALGIGAEVLVVDYAPRDYTPAIHARD